MRKKNPPSLITSAGQSKKKPSEIISQPVPSGTIAADRWLSIAKARKHYGWKPVITLENGGRELLEYFNHTP